MDRGGGSVQRTPEMPELTMIDRRGGETRRTGARHRTVALTAGACVVAAAAVLSILLLYQRTPQPVPEDTKRQSGSIVISTPDGDTCVRQQFDNKTGQVRHDAIIDCRNMTAGRGQGMRIEAISSGFRGR
jgi:hypothetical protein